MHFKKDVYRNLAMITQLGISMLAPIILCVFIGYQLDGHFGWNTVLPLLILGLLAGCRNCWVLLKRLTPGDGQTKTMTSGGGQPKTMTPGDGQTKTMTSGGEQPKSMTSGGGQEETVMSGDRWPGEKGREDETGS